MGGSDNGTNEVTLNNKDRRLLWEIDDEGLEGGPAPQDDTEMSGAENYEDDRDEGDEAVPAVQRAADDTDEETGDVRDVEEDEADEGDGEDHQVAPGQHPTVSSSSTVAQPAVYIHLPHLPSDLKIPEATYHKGADFRWDNVNLEPFASLSNVQLLCGLVHPDDLCGTLMLRLVRHFTNSQVKNRLNELYDHLDLPPLSSPAVTKRWTLPLGAMYPDKAEYAAKKREVLELRGSLRQAVIHQYPDFPEYTAYPSSTTILDDSTAASASPGQISSESGQHAIQERDSDSEEVAPDTGVKVSVAKKVKANSPKAKKVKSKKVKAKRGRAIASVPDTEGLEPAAKKIKTQKASVASGWETGQHATEEELDGDARASASDTEDLEPVAKKVKTQKDATVPGRETGQHGMQELSGNLRESTAEPEAREPAAKKAAKTQKDPEVSGSKKQATIARLKAEIPLMQEALFQKQLRLRNLEDSVH